MGVEDVVGGGGGLKVGGKVFVFENMAVAVVTSDVVEVGEVANVDGTEVTSIEFMQIISLNIPLMQD